MVTGKLMIQNNQQRKSKHNGCFIEILKSNGKKVIFLTTLQATCKIKKFYFFLNVAFIEPSGAHED